MMRRVFVIGAVSALGVTAALSAQPAQPAARVNPLLGRSTLQFQAPPFDKFTDADFEPAFEEGMKAQLAEVTAIANNTAAPTFDNTLVALERSGETLTRVQMDFGALSSSNTDDTLQALEESMAPKLAAHADAIMLNRPLFARIEALYNKRASLHLKSEGLRLLEYQYQQFVMAGAKLSEPDQERLKKYDEDDAALSAKFMNQLLAAAKDNALVVSDKNALAGLSPAEMDAAAEAAKAHQKEGQWLLPLINTTQQPALESLQNRATREQLFHLSWTRAEHGDADDTRETISKLAQIRANRAALLGQPNYAAWRLQDQMAKTPQQVQQFLDNLGPAALGRAKQEAADIQSLIDEQHGGFTLQPWDWNFYSEQVRQRKFNLDANEVKPYFELNRVLQDGVFFAAHELYGVSFKERHDLPVWQPDVRVFEVFDKNGSHLGLMYFDYFKRDNKNGGAWMDTLLPQSHLLGTSPIIYNVANFAKPVAGQPALINYDDVTTMFHEFGHALHGLFANQEYPTLSGTAVARDYVEFPSQFNERWAMDPKVFANYARHYQTGQPMPQELVDKIKKSETFNQGYMLTELLEAADLDMAWHTLPSSAPLQNVDDFETAAIARAHLDFAPVPPRYRSTYFLHIWANGYASGYYAYLWTEMLAADAFSWFDEHGGLTRKNGDRFRDLILSRGNTEDYAKMFRDFRGRDPKIDAMLEHRGLK
jgi:peptidyl-dipeptidase Dcp